MKKTFKSSLFLLFISIWLGTNCQNLKTYSGIYEKGNATYQYYENKDYERVLQGAFSYKSKSYDYSYFEQDITGIFKENFKDGLWTAKKTRTLNDLRNGEIKLTEILSGKYE